MTLKTEVLFKLISIFLCSWFASLTMSYGTYKYSDDIHCLKSIKASIEDPQNLLASWNFLNDSRGYVCHFVGIQCWHFDESRVINLNLSYMGLSGQFPNIDGCTDITGLDLSHNNLTGPIPRDLSKRLPYISSLDLSNNNLDGEIPSSLANCSYLNVLMLNNNQFTGQIPREFGMMPRLSTFSVAENHLSGKVPEIVTARFGPESFTNNKELCGRSLGSCPKEFHCEFFDGFAVGYSAFFVFVLGSASVVAWWQHQPKENTIIRFKKKASSRRSSTGLIRGNNMKISSLERIVLRMSYKELSMATDNFSTRNIIGIGNMGIMYKAELQNGWFLAVKRLQNYQKFKDEFAREVMCLGRLRHTNLLHLLGFSTERKEKLLVYKYMSNGTLHGQLHGKTLEWSLRVKIAIGIARGLAWLHHKCTIQVAHLNLSSKCILLDQKFEPKISNFGKSLSRSSKETNAVGNLIMSSEFWDLAFAKKDVHSFGVILFELITGEDPSQVTNNNSSSGFYDAVDDSLIGRGFDGEIFHLLRVASNCVEPLPDQRPTMLQVHKMLSEIGERYGITEDSEMLTQSQSISSTNSAGYARVGTTESQ